MLPGVLKEIHDFIAAAIADNGSVNVSMVGGTATDPSEHVSGGGATSVVFLAAPGTLREAHAQIDTAIASGYVWALLLDAAALPSNGVVTSSVIDAVLFAHSMGSAEIVNFDFGTVGRECSAGAVVVFSSTGWSAGAATLTKINSAVAAASAGVLT